MNEPISGIEMTCTVTFTWRILLLLAPGLDNRLTDSLSLSLYVPDRLSPHLSEVSMHSNPFRLGHQNYFSRMAIIVISLNHPPLNERDEEQH